MHLPHDVGASAKMPVDWHLVCMVTRAWLRRLPCSRQAQACINGNHFVHSAGQKLKKSLIRYFLAEVCHSACSPVSGRDAIPLPKTMILSELFQFLSFLHVMVTIDSRMCLSVLCFINVDSAVVITYYVKSRYRLLFWRAGRGTGEVLSCKEKGTKDMLKI